MKAVITLLKSITVWVLSCTTSSEATSSPAKVTCYCAGFQASSFEVIGGQSAQDADQLSATLQRLEVCSFSLT